MIPYGAVLANYQCGSCLQWFRTYLEYTTHSCSRCCPEARHG